MKNNSAAIEGAAGLFRTSIRGNEDTAGTNFPIAIWVQAVNGFTEFPRPKPAAVALLFLHSNQGGVHELGRESNAGLGGDEGNPRLSILIRRQGVRYVRHCRLGDVGYRGC